MDGVINIYKETGITSFDAVRTIRKMAHTKKVGHTGTLDPEASGVLPICIGKATKIVDFIMNSSKTYIAELKLGIITDTYDREGRILEQNDVNITEEQVFSALSTFKGETNQVPPMYSALKVNGKKLYELARQGIEIERKARKITIHDLDIISVNMPYVIFRVRCSKGTYIRSLCFDIGNLLGCGGTMWNLERTETGAFNKDNSIHLRDLNEDNIEKYIIPIEQCLSKFEKVSFDRHYEKLLLNGVAMSNTNVLDKIKQETLYRVYIEEDFIGIGEKQKSGFKIVKLLI